MAEMIIVSSFCEVEELTRKWSRGETVEFQTDQGLLHLKISTMRCIKDDDHDSSHPLITMIGESGEESPKNLRGFFRVVIDYCARTADAEKISKRTFKSVQHSLYPH